MGQSLTIQELVEARGDSFALELLTPGVTLDRVCSDPDVASPGLALAGFVERFPSGRMQVFGETEMTYLGTLAVETCRERVRTFFSLDVPGRLRHEGPGCTGLHPGCRARAPRPPLPHNAHDAGLLPEAQALPPVRPRALALYARVASRRLRRGPPLRRREPESERASASWIWWSAGTGWWPTTSFTYPGAGGIS